MSNNSIAGESYKERVNNQIDQWVSGNSIHNDVDNECCPDFSCCNKKVSTDIEIKKTYQALHKKGDSRATEGMLMSFLGAALATVTDKNVYITNGDPVISGNQN